VNPDYEPAFQDAVSQTYYNERGLYEDEGWEQSRSGGKTFTVSVLSGPDAGAFLDYYYYSDARRKRDELLCVGVCAIMRVR